jgi:hypothetical protein
MLGLGILIPPAASGAVWPFHHPRNQASRMPISLQLTHVAALGSAKYVNDVSTVANLIPRVNLTTTLWTITKAA